MNSDLKPLNKRRLDKVLVEDLHWPSRQAAQDSIKGGRVFYRGKVLKKPSFLVDDASELKWKEEKHYVGRGAHKLLPALAFFNLSPANKVCADLGACTGGFSQVLLEKEAKKVYAVDVGHDQLAKPLLAHPLLENYEGVNLRHPFSLPQKVSLVVADLSFISLRLILPNIFPLLENKGQALILFKPQFEGAPQDLGKNGVIKDERSRERILHYFIDWCAQNKYPTPAVTKAALCGREGNQEYFLLFSKADH